MNRKNSGTHKSGTVTVRVFGAITRLPAALVHKAAAMAEQAGETVEEVIERAVHREMDFKLLGD